MTIPVFRLCIVAAMPLVSLAPTALAQEDVAPVEGNRSDHREWQPTEGEVQSRERAAGIEAPESQQRATDQTLDELNQQLMRTDQQLRGEIQHLDGQGAGSGN